MLETVDSLLPKCYNAIAFAGGAVGGAVAFAVGGIDVAVQWLFAFVAVDYLLGVAAACKTHVWSSSTGFKGIIKKAVIFSVVCAEYESAAVGVDGVLSANLLDVTLAHGGVAVTGEQLTDRTLTGDLEIVTEDGEAVNVAF